MVDDWHSGVTGHRGPEPSPYGTKPVWWPRREAGHHGQGGLCAGIAIKSPVLELTLIWA